MVALELSSEVVQGWRFLAARHHVTLCRLGRQCMLGTLGWKCLFLARFNSSARFHGKWPVCKSVQGGAAGPFKVMSKFLRPFWL